jgi:hypothetical protein
VLHCLASNTMLYFLAKQNVDALFRYFSLLLVKVIWRLKQSNGSYGIEKKEKKIMDCYI